MAPDYPTRVSLRQFSSTASSQCSYVRAKWPGERLILFGQSMGAAAVLRAMATRGIKADATVLECPFDTLLHTVEARFAAMGLPAFPGAELLVFWGGLQHGFNGFAHNPVDYARGATGPVLMLHGAKDTRVTQSQLQSIYDNLPGEKEQHFFEGLGHEFYVVKRPEEWKEWVGRFLEK
jgi:alpha-beta hydrolase superfamily lysophospholipase